MRVIALQFDIAWEDKDTNFATVRRLLRAAAPEPGSLVVLPEMFATGFSMNVAKIVEPRGGATGSFLRDVAMEYQVSVVGGLAVRSDDGRLRNQAVAFSPEGQALGEYSKIKLFAPGGEAEHYIPGTTLSVMRFGGAMIAPFICYDLRFPELFRRATARWQPDLFLVVANWPEKRVRHWVRLLQARAIENQAFVVGVNRIGNDPFYSYSGQSLIADPQGDIVAECGSVEGWAQFEPDLQQLRKYRKGLPFLADLKPEDTGITGESVG